MSGGIRTDSADRPTDPDRAVYIDHLQWEVRRGLAAAALLEQMGVDA